MENFNYAVTKSNNATPFKYALHSYLSSKPVSQGDKLSSSKHGRLYSQYINMVTLHKLH